MSQDKMIQDILEVVTFLKDNAITREEHNAGMLSVERRITQAEERLEHKIALLAEELHRTKSEVFEHIDQFVVLHQKLELELTSMRAKYERLEQLVYRMAKQLNIEVTV